MTEKLDMKERTTPRRLSDFENHRNGKHFPSQLLLIFSGTKREETLRFLQRSVWRVVRMGKPEFKNKIHKLHQWFWVVGALISFFLAISLTSRNPQVFSPFHHSDDKPCHCAPGTHKYSGMVDDCCCDFETVDHLITEVLHPLLQELVTTPFFQYFKVKLWSDCLFWPDDGICRVRECGDKECPEYQFPEHFKKPLTCGLSSGDPVHPERKQQASVDRTIDTKPFRGWIELDNPWTNDDVTDGADWLCSPATEMTYVNLQLKPEGYTGYTGPSASRIWDAIYTDNCPQYPEGEFRQEKRILYKLISGVHSSISIHIAADYPLDEAKTSINYFVLSDNHSLRQFWTKTNHPMLRIDRWLVSNLSSEGQELNLKKAEDKNRSSRRPKKISWIGPSQWGIPVGLLLCKKAIEDKIEMDEMKLGVPYWGQNVTLMYDRVLRYPDRVRNLYFTFLFVLRAVTKTADYLEQADYETGDPVEDLKTKSLMRQLLNNPKLQAACLLPFDEAKLWESQRGSELKTQIQKQFNNISALMDCVTCEKCRIWGKLQFLGLGTALKILFSDDGQESWGILQLERNEVVALMNLLKQLSDSVNYVHEMGPAVLTFTDGQISASIYPRHLWQGI